MDRERDKERDRERDDKQSIPLSLLYLMQLGDVCGPRVNRSFLMFFLNIVSLYNVDKI